MTTEPQLRKLLTPILDRHSDLAMVGRYIVVTPVRHVLRCVVLDQTSSAKNTSVHYIALHLFQPRTVMQLNWGHWYGWMKLDRRDYLEALFEIIEESALPDLRAIQTLDHFMDFVSANPSRHQLFDRPEVKIIVDIARGDLETAKEISRQNLPSWVGGKSGLE